MGEGGAADGDEEGDGGSASKWTLAAYKRRLVEEVGEERAAQAWRDVDALVVKSLMMVEPTMAEACQTELGARTHGEPNFQCFQLYGFDVMFDASLKPWLLEVNESPDLRNHGGAFLEAILAPPQPIRTSRPLSLPLLSFASPGLHRR